MPERKERAANFIRELTAEFLARETNQTSLITITQCSVSPDLKRATIYMTAFPENKEAQALEFVNRKKSEIREHLKKNMNTKNVPFIEIAIDKGEKNRQKIDELLRQ